MDVNINMDSSSATRAIDLLVNLEQQEVRFWLEGESIKFRAPEGVMTGAVIASLKALKPQLVAILAVREQQETLHIDIENRFVAFPLSHVQAAYFVGRQSVFEYGGVGCHGYFEILAPCWDTAKLECVWEQMIIRHDMLRAIITPNGEQRILPSVAPFVIDQVDASSETVRQAMSHRVYQTDKWPLFDLKISHQNGKDCLHFSIDLLIADFLSVQILLAELFKGYLGQTFPAAPLTASFRDVIYYERQQQSGRAYGDARQYWFSRLPTLPACPQLPVMQTNASEIPRFVRYSHQLPPSYWQRLQQGCQQQGVSPSAFLLTVFSEVIGRWSENRHFTLNLTIMNRPTIHKDIDKLVGDFTSVSLLEVDLRSPKTVCERVKQIQRQLWQDLEHRTFSGIEVMREWGRQQGVGHARMPIVFTSALVGEGKNQVQEAISETQLDLVFDYGISQTPQVWIDCQIMVLQGRLQLNWDVMVDIFPKGVVAAMFSTFIDSVERIDRVECIDRVKCLYMEEVGTGEALCDSPLFWHSALSLPLPESQQQRRKQVNATEKTLTPRCLHDGILARAAQQPQAIALVDPQHCLTYAALITRAQALAAKLNSHQRYAVLMEKRHEQVVAVLGIFIAGSAYVPVDIHQPPMRILKILSDAAVSGVVTASPQACLADAHFREINLSLLAQIPDATETKTMALPHDLAYVIYTSGSTGQPKGVMISHDAAYNTLADLQQRIALTPDDRVLALARLSFDLSVFDIFGVLGAGGALIFPDEGDLQNPARWAHDIAHHQITLWNSVPAQMKMLTDYLLAEQITLPSLRYILLSGDWIPVNLPKEIAQVAPHCTQLALGGATEAAIWSNYWRMDPQVTYPVSIPYGVPLTNQQFRVVTPWGEDCPDWGAGELLIGGRGVAQGYWQDEAKTQAHFFIDTQGLRWYRTGDLGRYTSEGVIEFLGRLDHQIKVRGYRVETGEIESQLLKLPQVAQAVVMLATQTTHTELQAYIEAAQVSATSAYTQALREQGRIALAHIQSVAQQAGDALDRARIDTLFSLLDKVALMQMVKALSDMQTVNTHHAVTLDAIMEKGQVASVNRQLLRRWLRALTQHQYLQQVNDTYRLISVVAEQDIGICWQQCEQLITQLDDNRGLLTYLERSSQCLPELLQGKEDPLNLLFPDGRLDVATQAYQNNLISQFMNRLLLNAAEQKVKNQAQGRALKVLEIGAGVGGTSNVLIPLLAEGVTEYTFTDISPFFLNEAQKRYQHYNFIHYQLFDFNQSPIQQGLNCGQYDLVVAANVLHNAIIARHGLNNLRQLLAPGGWLLIIEATRDNYQLMTSMEFKQGLTAFEDERLALDSPFLPQQSWMHALQDVGAEMLWAYPPTDDVLHKMGQSFIFAQFNSQRMSCEPHTLLAYLQQQLPGYMVPAKLAILDKLPVSANGKIDRKQLPRLPECQQRQAPARQDTDDPLENTLLSLCRTLIGNNAMGVDDDFFTSGGDSLLITQWINQVREVLGEDKVPWEGCLRQVLQQPTARALAAYLRNIRDEEPESQRPQMAVTCLKERSGLKERAEEPVVILHEGSGTLLPYLSLVDKLSGPVYGVNVTDSASFLSIPSERLICQLASTYLPEIQKVGDQCHLVGYCMGGLLAFEIARQALEKGRPVSSLTIISSYQIPYHINDPLMIDLVMSWTLGVEPPWNLLKADLDDVYQAILADKPAVITVNAVVERAKANGLTALANEYTCIQQQSNEVRLSQLLTAIEQHSVASSHVSRQQFDVFRHSIQGVCQYQPNYFAGDMTFVCQQGETYLLPALQQDMTAFWQTYCIGQISSLTLPGDHFTCLSADNVSPLIQHLELCRGARG
ncbi:pyochelin synthetase [Yersinia similis]|nr:pyochelin synthetase [Yersinia similis]